jgi:hypothetical protein
VFSRRLWENSPPRKTAWLLGFLHVRALKTLNEWLIISRPEPRGAQIHERELKGLGRAAQFRDFAAISLAQASDVFVPQPAGEGEQDVGALVLETIGHLSSVTARKFARTFPERVASNERPSSLTSTRHQRSSPTVLRQPERLVASTDGRGCARSVCLAAGETADGFPPAPTIGSDVAVAHCLLRARSLAGHRTRNKFNHRSRPEAGFRYGTQDGAGTSESVSALQQE